MELVDPAAVEADDVLVVAARHDLDLHRKVVKGLALLQLDDLDGDRVSRGGVAALLPCACVRVMWVHIRGVENGGVTQTR